MMESLRDWETTSLTLLLIHQLASVTPESLGIHEQANGQYANTSFVTSTYATCPFE